MLNVNQTKNKFAGIIKVIGVGGGGSNAVDSMYKRGIKDVTFANCNTDVQILNLSKVPTRLALGKAGLGAGNDPKVGAEQAKESIEDIKQLFDDGTNMVFITAGMGGGTGTGASPIIAQVAKDLGILTVGIVTIPFLFEKRKKIIQAFNGITELSKHVDALLVINNQKITELFPGTEKTTLTEGFERVNDILFNATKSIAEIITIAGKVNLDFKDVTKVLKDGGLAIMSSGVTKETDNRILKAINNALCSPLLHNNKISQARKLLFNITTGNDNQLTIPEIDELTDYCVNLNPDLELIWGTTIDESKENEFQITLLATGFNTDNIPFVHDYKEELEEENEQLIAEQEDQIQKVYQNNPNNNTKINSLIYVYNIDELDNDIQIAKVDASPTYKRKQLEILELNQNRKKKLKIQKKPKENTDNMLDNGEILF